MGRRVRGSWFAPCGGRSLPPSTRRLESCGAAVFRPRQSRRQGRCGCPDRRCADVREPLKGVSGTSLGGVGRRKTWRENAHGERGEDRVLCESRPEHVSVAPVPSRLLAPQCANAGSPHAAACALQARVTAACGQVRAGRPHSQAARRRRRERSFMSARAPNRTRSHGRPRVRSARGAHVARDGPRVAALRRACDPNAAGASRRDDVLRVRADGTRARPAARGRSAGEWSARRTTAADPVRCSS